MAHCAKIKNGRVVSVHHIDNKHLIDLDGKESEEDGIYYLRQLYGHDEWKQTSYNTRRGEHILGGAPFRKNYAAKGYTYDKSRDAFIPPKPEHSCQLNEQTCNWECIIPMPDDGKNYEWVEQGPIGWMEIPEQDIE